MFYLSIGRQVEVAMGTFAFTIFYLLGMIGVIVMGCIFPISMDGGYLNSTLFFAYAFFYPNNQILVMYVIPVRVKYLAYFSGGLLAVQFVMASWIGKLLILSGVMNFLVFFGKRLFVDRLFRLWRKRKLSKIYHADGSVQHGKFTVYSNPYAKQKEKKANAKHCCEVCGRTELKDPNLEFRYCSVCEGYHEYCMEHLHQHEHKKSGEA